MAARVKPANTGGWVAMCVDCTFAEYGPMAHVDLAADVHNAEHHPEGAELTAQVTPINVPGKRRYRAWCAAHQDGYQGGKRGADGWAEKHNTEFHPQ